MGPRLMLVGCGHRRSDTCDDCLLRRGHVLRSAMAVVVNACRGQAAYEDAFWRTGIAKCWLRKIGSPFSDCTDSLYVVLSDRGYSDVHYGGTFGNRKFL